MSNSYDVALVMDQTTLNKGVQELFNAPGANHLFSGTEQINSDGIKSVDWSIKTSPTFTLAPPTQAQWDDDDTFFPGDTAPPDQPSSDMFQVEVTNFNIDFTMEDDKINSHQFSATVFVQITVNESKIVLGSIGVLPGDELSGLDVIFLQIIFELVIEKIEDILAAYTIPSSIDIEGFEFTPPVVTVTGSHLVVASNLLTVGSPPNIADVVWPDEELAVLASRNLMNEMVEQYSTEIIEAMDSTEVDVSDENWAGSYSIKGGIDNSSITLGPRLPQIEVSATASATVDIDVVWWLVPAACAIEFAANLLP